MRWWDFMIASLLVLVLVAITADSGSACACCTNPGQRRVGTERLSPGKRDELSRLRFGPRAQLFYGEGAPADIKGISAPSRTFEMRVVQGDDRWVFEFRNESGKTGTLSLSVPATVSVFEVDPRSEPDRGQGPQLYKEWTLTSHAGGTGIFTPGVGGAQRLSLVLQGGGNSCTTSDHFTHWTLLISGPKASYHLFGELRQ